MEPTPADVGIVTEWFIGFSKGKPRNWIHRLLCPQGLTHVYLCGYDRRLNVGICVEVLFHKTETRLLTAEELDQILGYTMENGVLLAYRVEKERISTFHRHFSCTAVIAHMLGVEYNWILTPNALREQLMRQGAVEISDGFNNSTDDSCDWNGGFGGGGGSRPDPNFKHQSAQATRDQLRRA